MWTQGRLKKCIDGDDLKKIYSSEMARNLVGILKINEQQKKTNKFFLIFFMKLDSSYNDCDIGYHFNLSFWFYNFYDSTFMKMLMHLF